jgi:hypothetical protein
MKIIYTSFSNPRLRSSLQIPKFHIEKKLEKNSSSPAEMYQYASDFRIVEKIKSFQKSIAGSPRGISIGFRSTLMAFEAQQYHQFRHRSIQSADRA